MSDSPCLKSYRLYLQWGSGICFFLMIAISGYSQSNNSYLSITPSYGKQLIFEDDTLIHDFIPGFDVSFGYSLSGKKDDDWVRFFNAKYLQFSFIYLDLSNLHGFYNPKNTANPRYVKNGLGHHFGLISSMQISLFHRKKFELSFLPGYGLSYITKTYFSHPEDNNRFIGSHLNFCIRFAWEATYRLSKNIGVIAGFRAIHFSNGGYSVPNAGVNSIGFNAGMNYYLKH